MYRNAGFLRSGDSVPVREMTNRKEAYSCSLRLESPCRRIHSELFVSTRKCRLNLIDSTMVSISRAILPGIGQSGIADLCY